VRTLKLKSLEGKQGDEGTIVTMDMQAWALTPHTLTRFESPEMKRRRECSRDADSIGTSGDAQSCADQPGRFAPAAEVPAGQGAPRPGDSVDGASEGEEMRFYSADETIIRDCYDKLLDGLDRMGSYLESGLLKPAELQPYFKYWVQDMASPATDDLSALWNVCLFSFMLVYGHEGTVLLFAHFGHDVTADGPLFKGFVGKLESAAVNETPTENGVHVRAREMKALDRRKGYLQRALELRVAARSALAKYPLLTARLATLRREMKQAR